MWCDMAGITQYVVSIVGIVFLGVLVDVILPDGEMNKFIKGMFALIAVFVIVSPIGKIINSGVNVDNLIETGETIQIDEDFLKATEKQYIVSVENRLKTRLIDSGFEGVNVKIYAYLSNNVLIIQKVKIDASNMVFTGQNEHINKYAEITKITVDLLNVEESDVFIDG